MNWKHIGLAAVVLIGGYLAIRAYSKNTTAGNLITNTNTSATLNAASRQADIIGTSSAVVAAEGGNKIGTSDAARAAYDALRRDYQSSSNVAGRTYYSASKAGSGVYLTESDKRAGITTYAVSPITGKPYG